jgi:hypothetical protein
VTHTAEPAAPSEPAAGGEKHGKGRRRRLLERIEQRRRERIVARRRLWERWAEEVARRRSAALESLTESTDT